MITSSAKVRERVEYRCHVCGWVGLDPSHHRWNDSYSMCDANEGFAKVVELAIEAEIELMMGEIRELPRKKLLHGFRSEYYIHLPSTLGIIAKHRKALINDFKNSAKPNEKGRE